LSLPSDLKTYLSEIYLLRENQGSEGRKRLESSEIGIGPIPERREWKRILNKWQYGYFEIMNKWEAMSGEGRRR
jgi:hypothetical protein